jgi:hypothetical protein
MITIPPTTREIPETINEIYVRGGGAIEIQKNFGGLNGKSFVSVAKRLLPSRTHDIPNFLLDLLYLVGIFC